MMHHSTAQSIWSEPERVELLRRLWAEGRSCSDIASTIGAGCTRNSVIGKANRLGLERRRGGNFGSQQLRAPKPPKEPRVRIRKVAEYAPKIEAEPFIPLEEIEIPEAQRKTLLQLTEQTCRWPVGDPQCDDFYFCGGDVGPKGCAPYCKAHASIAYTPASARPKVTAEQIRHRQRSHKAEQVAEAVAA